MPISSVSGTATASPASAALLGQQLLASALVNEPDLARALQMQGELGGRLGAWLVRLGALSEEQLLVALARQLGLPLLGREVTLPEAARLGGPAGCGLDADWQLDQQALLWQDPADQWCCAARDPLLPWLREALAYALPGLPVRWVLAGGAALERGLAGLAVGREADDTDQRQLRELAEEAPIVELVNGMLAQAVEQRASDIHFEPGERGFAIRFRIDGVLYTRSEQPRERFAAVASRLKLISGMDIAERRLPQDGRLSVRASGEAMDVRASALPGVHGESIVLRLLPKERRELGLGRLGMEADHLALLSEWTQQAHGIVLVTGPTGSGKSTTLYAALAAANDGRKKIITVEDPVEFQLPGITQIQTHADIGLDFASVLRSVLRQDPDVVMVGEIRDRETAQIAVQASLTGHLVLSTVHTNDALGAFTRLIDMGVEPFLVATPIRGVQAQRLVRRLCEHCAEPAGMLLPALEAEARRWAGQVLPGVPANWRQAGGCARCQGIGYRGRLGIYELVPVDETLQQAVAMGEPHPALVRHAREQGHRSLRDDGLLKAWQGLTSVEEVLRVTAG